MIEVIVHEDELKSCARRGTLVHAGVTSCLTVSAVLQNEIVGLHVVQFAANGTTYVERLPGLIALFNARVHGRAIDRLILVAPMMFFPEGVEDDISQSITNAPAPLIIDITNQSAKGNDIYIIGSANTVMASVEGAALIRQTW